MPNAAGHGVAIERRILDREHREIEHVVARIETTAEMAGNLAAQDLANALRSLLNTIEKTLLPHLDWEDDFCFPEIDRLAATPLATRVLRLQHGQIRQAVERLEADWLAVRREPSHRQLVERAGPPLRVARAHWLSPRAGGARHPPILRGRGRGRSRGTRPERVTGSGRGPGDDDCVLDPPGTCESTAHASVAAAPCTEDEYRSRSR